MALTKCYECGQEISDKASTCPHCGIKIKHKKKSSNIMLIAIIIAVCLVVSIVIINIFKRMSYPNVIGAISLNMKQEEIENILLNEIQGELNYSNLNFESDGAQINVSGQSLTDMNFSKEHPNIAGIWFCFDTEDKLCEIVIFDSNKSFKSVCKEYNIDIENVTYFYGGSWTKGYVVNGNMYTQISVVENINSNDGALVIYKRISDAESITDLQK